MALHSQTFLLELRLAVGPKAQLPAARPGFAVGCVRRVVMPAASLAFLGGSVVGCARPRIRDGTIGLGDRATSQASASSTKPATSTSPVTPGVSDERNALVRWAVLLEGVIG